MCGDVERSSAYGYDSRWVGEPCGGADPVRASRCSVTGDIAHRFRGDIDGADAVIITIGDVERTAAHGYACRAVELRGGAHTVGVFRRTAAGDRAHLRSGGGKVGRVYRNLADAVVIVIGDIERIAGSRRCTAWIVKPCRCARTIVVSTDKTIGYYRADSHRACVNSSDRMPVFVSNVERITDLRDPEWSVKTCRGADAVCTGRTAARECGNMPRLGLRRRSW